MHTSVSVGTAPTGLRGEHYLSLDAQQQVGGRHLVVLLIEQRVLDLLRGEAHAHHHLCRRTDGREQENQRTFSS